jgi:hypothetical protein
MSTPLTSPSRFSLAEHGVDVEETEPGGSAGGAFDAVGVGDDAAQHLITAANPEHVTAAAAVREDVDIPAFAAQRGEIGERRFRSRQDDERRIARQRVTRPHENQLDAGLGAQRVEIVEIGDIAEGLEQRS